MFITQLTRHELIASTCGSVGLSKINLFQSHLEQEPLLSFSCFLRSCSISAPVSFMCSSLLTGNLDESALISQRGGSLYVAITAHSTNTEKNKSTQDVGTMLEMYTMESMRTAAPSKGIYCFPVRLSPVIWMHVEVTEQRYSVWKLGIGFLSFLLVPQ